MCRNMQGHAKTAKMGQFRDTKMTHRYSENMVNIKYLDSSMVWLPARDGSGHYWEESFTLR